MITPKIVCTFSMFIQFALQHNPTQESFVKILSMVHL